MIYVKVVRRGNVLSSYLSYDGNNWHHAVTGEVVTGDFDLTMDLLEPPEMARKIQNWMDAVKAAVEHGFDPRKDELHDWIDKNTFKNAVPAFDMHAPFDAPIRHREMLEDADRQRAAEAMKDPEVQRKLSNIVEDAMNKVNTDRKRNKE